MGRILLGSVLLLLMMLMTRLASWGAAGAPRRRLRGDAHGAPSRTNEGRHRRAARWPPWRCRTGSLAGLAVRIVEPAELGLGFVERGRRHPERFRDDGR